MKYRKRYHIYRLLAGLTVLTSSCGIEPMRLQLLESKLVDDFPSASAIEYDDGKLYVFGDDAPYMLIMDTSYRRLDTVFYSIDTSYRMAKSNKVDIESATLIVHNNQKHLYALGSLSDDHRRKLFYFPLSDIHTYLSIDYSSFARKLMAIPELNIEGMAFVKSKLVLANRANKSHPVNQLILSDNSLHGNNASDMPPLIDISLENKNVIGISGLYYVEARDLMLFTASEEDTPSATQDGAISDSYLGCIRDFSWKMKDRNITPDQLVRLSDIHPDFKKQKVEAVCVQEQSGNEMTLQLVADNDNGESSFFKLRLVVPE